MKEEIFDEDPARTKARKKDKEFGIFALTADDHLSMGSTPPEELLDDPEKALYEVMTDEEIEEDLNTMLDYIYDPKFWKNGVANNQKEIFLASIPFLRSVSRLPEAYEDFDTTDLPDFR